MAGTCEDPSAKGESPSGWTRRNFLKGVGVAAVSADAVLGSVTKAAEAGPDAKALNEIIDGPVKQVRKTDIHDDEPGRLPRRPPPPPLRGGRTGAHGGGGAEGTPRPAASVPALEVLLRRAWQRAVRPDHAAARVLPDADREGDAARRRARRRGPPPSAAPRRARLRIGREGARAARGHGGGGRPGELHPARRRRGGARREPVEPGQRAPGLARPGDRRRLPRRPAGPRSGPLAADRLPRQHDRQPPPRRPALLLPRRGGRARPGGRDARGPRPRQGPPSAGEGLRRSPGRHRRVQPGPTSIPSLSITWPSTNPARPGSRCGSAPAERSTPTSRAQASSWSSRRGARSGPRSAASTRGPRWRRSSPRPGWRWTTGARTRSRSSPSRS